MITRNKKAIAGSLKPAVYRLTNLVTDPKVNKATQAVAKECIITLMAVICELEIAPDQDV